VVKTSEYRRCQNTMMSGNVMALDLRLDFRRHWLGYSWSEARMRTSSIVVTDPSLKNSPDMFLIKRNYEVQTFPSCASNHPFANRVRLGCSIGCFEYRQTESLK
jgi:hypothetical protein